MKKCETKSCKKQSERKYCHSCNIKVFKENNPEKYSYFVLKNNAKRRGKEFSITFDYFLLFVKKHNYIAGKGITKNGLHIDRINESMGYVEGNLQVMTNTENVKKYLRYNYDKNNIPCDFKIMKSIVIDNNELDPF